MTRLGLSITVLSLLFSGAVLAAPSTPVTQSSDTKATPSHVENTKAGKKSDKTAPKQHSHQKAASKEAKKAH
ncbi:MULTISPECIES: hypothetical protein [Photorhabdus]|uniref:Uncharacterized protein n=2 Tax=Photorhabdus TaxID=29487 RepID=A0A0A0CRG1_9GAMM|nr:MULTISPECIES: hypothetical protein [Photorhabdus]KGM28315.1 hypothetical protein KS18_10545 [Photorhabdus luminescens]EYU14524.1 hypothetical protein BA1DRAFT_02962 [Photorhabdus aegyptia]MBS9430789.1 hypothetical protein [Photorhabdus akhurstii]MBS9435320.1 hypothetical protein [Photorhabdus hainanensis]MCC8459895.1 hypothetical protein [Photorhabdus aegyptia]